MGKGKKIKQAHLVEILAGQVLMRTDFGDSYEESHTREVVDSDAGSANLVSSMVKGSDLHRPVLDIDLPVAIVPSSTPGHFHLFIDKEMTWVAYLDLLIALANCGIIEPGYLKAAQRRVHTAVRLPWVQKGDKVDGN